MEKSESNRNKQVFGGSSRSSSTTFADLREDDWGSFDQTDSSDQCIADGEDLCIESDWSG